MLLQNALQLRAGNHAHMPPGFLAFFEQNKSGNTLDAHAASKGGVAVNVHLDDGGLFPYFLLHVLKDGRHHLAGAAPTGREVNEYGLFTTQQFFEAYFIFHDVRIVWFENKFGGQLKKSAMQALCQYLITRNMNLLFFISLQKNAQKRAKLVT
jgi:hypothetical protein